MNGIRIIELFSGIGSQFRALSNIGLEPKTIATCEWDIHALLAYYLFHHSNIDFNKINDMCLDTTIKYLKGLSLSNDGKKPMDFKSISKQEKFVLNALYESIIIDKNMIDITKVDSLMSESDILTYSFPCQDLSNVGAIHGYTKGIAKNSHSRSSLLWEVGRILNNTNKRLLPKYLVMENVRTLLSNRHYHNFKKWINDLSKLGYSTNKYFVLDTCETGLPQRRQRLIMFSVLDNKSTLKEKNYFNSLNCNKIYLDYKKYLKNSNRYSNKFHSVMDLIQLDYRNSKILKEALVCTPNDTPSRRKIRLNNPIIDSNLDAIPTLTTKQDRHPNSGTITFTKAGKNKSRFRYLTPRECLMFMGFNKSDFDKLDRFNDYCNETIFFKRDIIYHMAGNSIPVNLLESVFYQIKKIVDKDFS